MALRRQAGAIPEGAVVLNEADALQYQWKRISSWKPAVDVFPLKHGVALTAVASGSSAIYINAYYRKALRLGNHGRIVSYLPSVVIPAIAASLYHQQKVMADVLIMKTECPVCVQIRSATIQALFGSIYPTVLAPFAGFMMAVRHYTYDVPSITETPKETFKLWLKLTRRLQGFLVAAALGQALFGSGLAYLQMRSMFKVTEKMIAEEKEEIE